MGLLCFLPEFLPGVKVHPRHLRDPSGTENSLGFWLRHGAARLQLQRGDQQDIREGEERRL